MAFDGTQTEFVHIPFADTGLYRVPHDGVDEGDGDAERHPADRLPGCGVLNGRSGPGGKVRDRRGWATVWPSRPPSPPWFYSPAEIIADRSRQPSLLQSGESALTPPRRREQHRQNANGRRS